MRFAIIIALLVLCVSAQAQEKKVKSDSTQDAFMPEVIERNMIKRNTRMAELKKEIDALQELNDDDYTAILQFNHIDRDRIVGQPAYQPGKLIFRLKAK